MGSELVDAETNELIWLAPENLKTKDNDPWLIRLMLESDGISVNSTTYCTNNVTKRCSSEWDCGIFADCISGRQMIIGNVLNINPNGGLGKEGYTAYKELYEFLNGKGYTLGQDIYSIAYDWRLDNETIAQAINILIKGNGQGIVGIASNPCDKVQIIAHSMGGLVVRSYLEKNPADNRIDKVIYLGTPHFGSPKMFAVLANYGTIIIDVLRGIIEDTNINVNTASFVCQNFPSIYQLLPRFNFFKGEDYSDSFERLTRSNPALLEKANSFHDKISASRPNIKQYQISGSGQLTLGEFEVRNGGCIFPIAHNGDGTVPQEGSQGLSGVKYFYVNGEHGALPGNPAVHAKIWQIINNNEDAMVDLDDNGVEEVQSTPFPILGSWNYNKCSPIKLDITDSQGNLNNGDDEGNVHEEISNSLYLKIDHQEAGFLPLDDEYHVKIQALESGTFTLTFEAMDENGTIYINTKDLKDFISIKIKNTGSYISPKNLPHIFELFSSKNKNKE